MKNCWYSIVLALFLFGLSFLFSRVREQAFGQPLSVGAGQQVIVRPPAEPPKWLVDFSTIDDPGHPVKKIRVITIVDPESKRILVYHEDQVAGTVKWCSTRNIQPDIWVDDFNSVKPTPREVEEEIQRLRKN